MKALTICQPYAHLILLPDDDPRHKFIENRGWECFYRGPLLIHAGKSRSWLDSYGRTAELGPLDYGAIIGAVRVIDCVHVPSLREGRRYRNLTDAWHNAILEHQHTEGPFGIVLGNRRRFTTPIPYRGAQGLFNVPDEVVAEALREVDYLKAAS